MLLIPNFQLCLAHFCEVHGPTPLMVTEGLPVRCKSCDDNDDAPDELMMAVASAVNSAAASIVNTSSSKSTKSTTTTSSSSSTPHAAATAATHAVTDALRKMNLNNLQQSPASASPAHSITPRSHPDATAAAAAAVNSANSNNSANTNNTTVSSNFRKTYDDSVTKRAVPCDNCAMTLPATTQDSSTASASSSSSATDTRIPILRTRVPCARVYDNSASSDASSSPFLHPLSSASSSTSSDEGDDHRHHSHHNRNAHHHRTGTMTSVSMSRSSTSSSTSHVAGSSHTHYLDYTSTHEPVSPNAFGIIRQSCLRTLTLETLPRSPASATASQPQPPLQTSPAPSYFSSPSAGPPAGPNGGAASASAAAAAANGGPLFFGDPAGGYTTAHVFRVADMHARGHKRVYALIALNTHRERMAMKAFGFVSAAFNDLATWIQQLADDEAERVALNSQGQSPASIAAAAAASAYAQDRSPPATQPSSLSNTGGSSFLVAAGNGLSRRMGPGYAGYGGFGGSSAAASLRARSLPEILGKPNFFIELHTRFVRLLLELGVALN